MSKKPGKEVHILIFRPEQEQAPMNPNATVDNGVYVRGDDTTPKETSPYRIKEP